jgi:putative FmdB family regulatory protein
MPIYEYLCQDCGTKFEKLVRRASETPELACPSCGEKHLQQEFSTFAAHANGSPKPSGGATPPCQGGGCCNPGACGMNFN